MAEISQEEAKPAFGKAEKGKSSHLTAMFHGGDGQRRGREGVREGGDVSSSDLANDKVVTESLNPVWTLESNFRLGEDGLHDMDMLMLEVYDHDTFRRDYMGRCIPTLTQHLIEEDYSDSFPLEGAKTGKLNLHLKWSPQSIFRDSGEAA